MRAGECIQERLRAAVALVSALAVAVTPTLGYALPTDGVVNGGAATISSNANTMNISQSTNKAIIDWSSFNIGANESVIFSQPSASAIALNRIHDSNPSQILGNLSANGQVWLINQNGVMFGSNAQVNVAGLLVTSANISNANFMAGSYVFDTPGSAGASISNAGAITVADGGLAAFVAPTVTNSGVITARLGKVQLGSADTFTLDLYGDGLINLAASPAVTQQIIHNSGSIAADGGSVLLTTAAAQGVVNSLINMEGIVQANHINVHGDVVELTGTLDARGATGGSIDISARNLAQQGSLLADGSNGDGGTIHLAFTGAYIDNAASIASVTGANGNGGSIWIDGSGGDASHLFASGIYNASGINGGSITFEAPDFVYLYGTQVNASGTHAGGSIKIGGDFHGGGTTTQALDTVVNGAVTLTANGGSGDGGTIVVWSGESTRFEGTATATSVDGNGGTMEISSAQGLSISQLAVVDASSAHGTNGTVLFDPKNITVSSGATDPNGNISYFELVDPNPDTGTYGTTVVALSNGNVVVTDYGDDFVNTNAGAVYLFNGTTGALISTLTGSTSGDAIGSGGITALTGNGNFVVSSPNWNNGAATKAGAATWCSGTAGCAGSVSTANSLYGTTTNDEVGLNNPIGITILTNGNYVVDSYDWHNGAVAAAGAVTWINGSNGHTVNGNLGEAVGTTNSLYGTTVGDVVGYGGSNVFDPNIVVLTNGNYVVRSYVWDNGSIVDAGAATWGNGATGTVGAVSTANSLYGTTANDGVGWSVTALSNGNYVVGSPLWNNGAVAAAGAVTWINGSNGHTVNGNLGEAVGTTNSLYGSTADDTVGDSPVVTLTNGNYVVLAPFWDNGATADVGAVTWGNGATGTVGAVSTANSLYSTTAGDLLGLDSIVALTNGNYVVDDIVWSNGATADVGAVTWCNGNTGCTGAVSIANSLHGSTNFDEVGATITALTNGNYVVESYNWHNGGIAVGAATWCNGNTGCTGAVSTSNSLYGSTANDFTSFTTITALTNGNYVVDNPMWDNGATADVGAVTWINGSNGHTVNGNLGEAVSTTNSLYGSTASDKVGGVYALSNGNYVVVSNLWDNGATVDAGAVTWGNGSMGTTGAVSTANSIYGSTANDQVGSVTALTNGDYVIASPAWDNGGTINAGAVTLCVGTSACVGPITSSNSIIGPSASAGLQSIVADPAADRFIVRFTTAQKVYSASDSADPNAYVYAYDAGADYSFTPAFLTAVLNTGTNVKMQANNDITISDAITANNGGGNGGALEFDAGRSILVNANITTDSGNFTLIANDTAAHGVVDADRDAGTAAITMGSGTAINAGTGNVTVTLDTGAGNTNHAGGDITLYGITSQNLTVTNNGSTGGQILMDGMVASSGNVSLSAYSNIITAASMTTSGGTITLRSDNAANGAGAISIGGDITSGGGNITLGGGNGVISAGTGYAYGNSGQADAVNINAGVNAGAGSIIANGIGYDNTTTGGGGGNGITVTASGFLTVSASGMVNLHGTGGNGAAGASNNALGGTGSNGGFGGDGMLLNGSVIGASGSVSLTGTSGNGGTGGSETNPTLGFGGFGGFGGYGIIVGGSGSVSSTSGPVSLTGTGNSGGVGGSGTGGPGGNGGYGVETSFGTSVTSTSGTISIVGTGGTAGTGGASNGVTGNGGAGIVSEGSTGNTSNDIVMTGTGGDSTSSGLSDVEILDAVTTTGAGNITITGINGTALGTVGISIFNGNNVRTTGTGNITAIADSISLGAANALNSGGNLTIRPYTNGTNIYVGAGGTSSDLQITDAYLGDMNQGAGHTLTIGDNNSGNMDIDTAVTFSKAVQFTSGGAITLDSSLTGTGAGAFGFTGATTLNNDITTTGGAIAFNSAVTLGTDVALDAGAGTMTFGSTINGTHDLTANAGTLSFGGALGGIAPLGAISLASTNALTLPAIHAGTLLATTGAGHNISTTGQITASGNDSTGAAVVLASGGNYVNSAGAGVFDMTGGGRWLIYSADPALNTLNGLVLPTEVHSETYSGYPPASVVELGDVMFYSAADSSSGGGSGGLGGSNSNGSQDSWLHLDQQEQYPDNLRCRSGASGSDGPLLRANSNDELGVNLGTSSFHCNHDQQQAAE